MVTPANNEHTNTVPVANTEKQYRITKGTAIFWSTASVITVIAGVILESLGVILVGAIGLVLTLILRNREVKIIAPTPTPQPVPEAKKAPEPAQNTPVPPTTPVRVNIVEVTKGEPAEAPGPEAVNITVEEFLTPSSDDEKDDDIESTLPAPLYVDFDEMERNVEEKPVPLAEGQSPSPETSARGSVSESDGLLQPTLQSAAVTGEEVTPSTPPAQQAQARWRNPFSKKTERT